MRKEHRGGLPVPPSRRKFRKFLAFSREQPRSPTRFITSFRAGATMKTSKLTLAGAGLLLLATPAFAGHSMPAEREATRQLNLEAARQGQNSNQASAPQTQFAVADASANMPADSPPAAAPTARIESAAIEAPVK